MIQIIKKKFKRLLIAWGIFFCFFGISALFIIFIMSPIIIFFRLGTIALPSTEYIFEVIKDGILGSFLAALVTWFWVEFFPNIKIK